MRQRQREREWIETVDRDNDTGEVNAAREEQRIEIKIEMNSSGGAKS